jgi:glycosyltransferase involved in cell wall biosynthesis
LDDASEDGSAEILQQFVSQNPETTSLVVNSVNSGSPFSQWKRGLAAAKGDLIWIAESDDFCDPSFLAELVPLFSNQAVMLAFCRTVFVDASSDREVWSMHDYIPEISARPGVNRSWSVHTSWQRGSGVGAISFLMSAQLCFVYLHSYHSWRILSGYKCEYVETGSFIFTWHVGALLRTAQGQPTFIGSIQPTVQSLSIGISPI